MSVDSSAIDADLSVQVLEKGLDKRRRPSLTDMRDMRYLTSEQVEDMLVDAATLHKRRESRQMFLRNKLLEHEYGEEPASEIAETLSAFIPQPEEASSSVATETAVSKSVTLYEPKSAVSTKAKTAFSAVPMKAITMGSVESMAFTMSYDPLRAFVPLAPNRRNQFQYTLDRRLSVELRPSPETLKQRGILRDKKSDDSERFRVKESLEEALHPKRRPSVHDLADRKLIPNELLVDLYGLAEDVRKDHSRMESAIDDMVDSLGIDPAFGRMVAEQTLLEIEEIDPTLKPLSDEFYAKEAAAAASKAATGRGALASLPSAEKRAITLPMSAGSSHLTKRRGSVEVDSAGDSESKAASSQSSLSESTKKLTTASPSAVAVQSFSYVVADAKDKEIQALQHEVFDLRRTLQQKGLDEPRAEGGGDCLECAVSRERADLLKDRNSDLQRRVDDLGQSNEALRTQLSELESGKQRLLLAMNSEMEQLRSYLRRYTSASASSLM